MQGGRTEYKHGKSARFKVKTKGGEHVQEQTSQEKEETGDKGCLWEGDRQLEGERDVLVVVYPFVPCAVTV